MEKLSGLILDHYDDTDGEVLRDIFPTFEEVPSFIKQASHHPREELDRFPSDLFALELVNNDVVMRKFACTDKGNTALSVQYFLKTGHKLPAEAQKVAAENLVKACAWYGLEPPEDLKKVAVNLLTLAMAPSVVKGTKDQIGRNMQVAKASGNVVNPKNLSLQSTV